MTIRRLTAADIPAAQRLREQAGWNQSDEDWSRLLAWEPDGCWGVDRDGLLVGTAAVISYGQEIAWIGMVLVDEGHRRQGIGRALLLHALDALDRRGVRTIALDATPAGQPLYAQLGFVDAFGLERWRGPLAAVPATAPSAALPRDAPAAPIVVPDPADLSVTPDTMSIQADIALIRPLGTDDLPAVVAYDAMLFGVGRGHVLRALVLAADARRMVAVRAGHVVGYALSRPGARAWHLGPLAADAPATAAALARAVLPPEPGRPCVMDVVLPNAHAPALAGALGLAPVRPFIRMTRGAAPPTVDTGRLYTSAGPELG